MPLLSYTGTRGWSPEQMQSAVDRLTARGWLSGEVLTEEGRAVRAEIERATDMQEQGILDAIGDRLEETCTSLQSWGDACIAAGSFPADILKRAAG